MFYVSFHVGFGLILVSILTMNRIKYSLTTVL